MNVNEFIGSEILKMPIKWREEDSRGCHFAINGRLIGYINYLDHLDDQDDLFKNNRWNLDLIEVKKLASKFALGLTNVLSKYLNESNRYAAYEVFKNTLEEENKYGSGSSIRLEELLLVQRIPDISYRIRSSESFLLDQKDLFHIPFDERYKVADERYSVSGNPCLYLSNSLYLCFREKQLESYNNQYASLVRYFPFDEIKNYVLDLTWDRVLVDSESKLRFIITWPLLAACNIFVHDYDHKFRCEYLIPQMILNWVMHGRQRILGVKYNSTKISPNFKDIGVFYNYAFPAKSNLGLEYGVELTEYFHLTKPIHMTESFQSDSRIFKLQHQVEQVDLLDSVVKYEKTHFAAVENYLLGQPTHKVLNSRYNFSDYTNLLMRKRKK